MSVSAMAQAHAGTVRLGIHEVVRRMNRHLGATVVAALAGSKDSKTPYRWAKDTTPQAEAEERIRTGHRVWMCIADAESDHVARAWFMGSSPALGETSPVLALREGRTREVIEAAEAFVNDAWIA